MAWTIVLLDEVEEWFLAMVEKDPHTAELVTAPVDLLEQEGPTLRRPAVDRLKGSKLHNLKELRPRVDWRQRGTDVVRLRPAPARGHLGGRRQVRGL